MRTAPHPQVSELLICVSQPASGGSARSAYRAFEVTATADVAAPLLEWSRRGLDFSYVYHCSVAAEVVKHRLDMR